MNILKAARSELEWLTYRKVLAAEGPECRIAPSWPPRPDMLQAVELHGKMVLAQSSQSLCTGGITNQALENLSVDGTRKTGPSLARTFRTVVKEYLERGQEYDDEVMDECLNTLQAVTGDSEDDMEALLEVRALLKHQEVDQLVDSPAAERTSEGDPYVVWTSSNSPCMMHAKESQ